MSKIKGIYIKNFRGIKELKHFFNSERFIVLIGRGDSGKSTILSAIQYALSPSWNISFSDLDFYNQDTSVPIEIMLWLTELSSELLKEQKFGLYVENPLDNHVCTEDLSIVLKLKVSADLEPKWTVIPRNKDVDEKNISASDRALLGLNFIGDYTDTQFAYNRQSPLYALTKAFLDKEQDIERIKTKLLRALSSNIDDEHFKVLNGPLNDLKTKALALGLSIEDIYANIDIKENPYTGNSIALHHNSLPYRLQGKGSKRLMSIAIQSELTKSGGIMLVDEIEQGLEPDRIRTLVNILKSPERGQVFITTHNTDVIKECLCNNLFVVTKGVCNLSKVSVDLDNCRRYIPGVFFTPKVICCEGDTEYGILESIDKWITKTQGVNFSALGVSIANVGGGANMFLYSAWLKDMGFDTCVFADDDIKDKDKPAKEKCQSLGIPLFLCQEGYCSEKQIFQDLPWNAVVEILNCPQTNFPKSYSIMTKELGEKLNKKLSGEAQLKIRTDQAARAIEFKWFKHLPGGQFLGEIIAKYFNEMSNNTPLKQCINSLISWSRN
ncbi:MAG: AAA family ATPase [Bacteroides sp.]|nr:AAA family ATPase [Bacteroides sp.]